MSLKKMKHRSKRMNHRIFQKIYRRDMEEKIMKKKTKRGEVGSWRWSPAREDPAAVWENCGARGARRRLAPRGLPCCGGRAGGYHLGELGRRGHLARPGSTTAASTLRLAVLRRAQRGRSSQWARWPCGGEAAGSGWREGATGGDIGLRG
jgi:hypothetical protein